MAVCRNCNKGYFNNNMDAGTYREIFCSPVCQSEFNDKIDSHVDAHAKLHKTLKSLENDIITQSRVKRNWEE